MSRHPLHRAPSHASAEVWGGLVIFGLLAVAIVGCSLISYFVGG